MNTTNIHPVPKDAMYVADHASHLCGSPAINAVTGKLYIGAKVEVIECQPRSILQRASSVSFARQWNWLANSVDELYGCFLV